jgi:hypothetical protein
MFNPSALAVLGPRSVTFDERVRLRIGAAQSVEIGQHQEL